MNTGAVVTLVNGYDRHKVPQQFNARVVTLAELKEKQSATYWADCFRDGRARCVKITSIKEWKTRDIVQVRVKYGLYECFHMDYSKSTGLPLSHMDTLYARTDGGWAEGIR